VFGLAILVAVTAQAWSQDISERFYADDPLLAEPSPHAVKSIKKLNIDELYDFLENSFETPHRAGKAARRDPHPALNVNSIGGVPDSSWYTNRHFAKPMSLEELKRGPGNSTPPSADGPWRVISAKSDGVMPGFVIEDANKSRYVLKLDPPRSPELASAADVIGSKVFYALGYNTPENYIVHFKREKLHISEGVKWRDAGGKKRPLTDRILDEILKTQPHTAGGTYRAMASRWIEGDPIGPFRYEGTRSDDPNDIVAHEDRRELRGLRVFAAWLNHTDAKSINSLDSLVTRNGVPFVQHYLMDFGSTLGSAGTDRKEPWYGHEYIIDYRRTAVQMATLGLYAPKWVRSDYPNLTGAGLFDHWSFDPVAWKSDYPNPAFLLMDREDAFWAAKQVTAFSDAEIRALVETGEYSDPRTVDWITECVIKRRDKIAQAWLSTSLALDRFAVVDGVLTFEQFGGMGREYSIRWAARDNRGHVTPFPGQAGTHVPAVPGDAQYLIATITPLRDGPSGDPITVYLRRTEQGIGVVGIYRR